MKHGVLQGDRQAEPGPARSSYPGGVRAPEPVEEELSFLARPEPDPMVADHDRHVLLAGVDAPSTSAAARRPLAIPRC